MVLAKILGVEEALLINLDKAMSEKTGRTGILDKVIRERDILVKHALEQLNLSVNSSPNLIREALMKKALRDEADLLKFMNTEVMQNGEFDKAARLAKKIGKPKIGFFLKKSKGEEILKKRTPYKLLEFLNLKGVDELFRLYGIDEVFSALRFVETNEWMHETFKEAYSGFTSDDFEEREIEIKVLGPEWMEVAKKFVEKKHHNVSHLKEFGVIFLNPIKEDTPGKFLRDFALLLHYYNEIDFYSKLFKKYSLRVDFAEKFKSLLRGDVAEENSVVGGEWLMIQRYLFKENPNDPRLSLPHMNPESLHWAKAEDNLVLLGQGEEALDLEFWKDLDWVGDIMSNNGEEIPISFDIEDNLMSAVSAADGKNEYLTYHQREALWTKIFAEYCGGREKMEEVLIENFDKGKIQF